MASALDHKLLALSLTIKLFPEVPWECVGLCRRAWYDPAKGFVGSANESRAAALADAELAKWGDQPYTPYNRVGPRYQWTRLHEAVWSRRTWSVPRLLELGARINARDMAGRTPLYLAATRGYADVVAELLKAPGVDVNLGTVYGGAPLHVAVSNGESHLAVIGALLNAPGVDVNATYKDAHNWNVTPLKLARRNHDEVKNDYNRACPVVKLLETYGAVE